MTEVLDRDSLKALSADTRQEIVKLLEKRPYTASELSKKLNKHVTTVSEHLLLLEKSGLVIRKDSSNKWIYYILTNKGEKIFKPAYYSWVVILSISVLALVFGVQQLFSAGTVGESYKAPTMEQAGDVALQSPDTGMVLGIILIIIAIIGFVYLIIKKLRK